MSAAYRGVVRQWLDKLSSRWLPPDVADAGVQLSEDDTELRSAYRLKRRQLHAQRVPLAYTFFLTFAGLCTLLEYVFYPERARAMIVALACYATVCIVTILLVRQRPAWTSPVAVLGNNALILCTTAYYVPVRGSPETCALTLVLFMAALPLLNAAGGRVQALSCVGALIGYPFVLLVAAEQELPPVYGMTAIFGAIGVTVFGASLLDRQRYAAFRSLAALHTSEERLRGVSERYRALYEHNPAMYFTVEADGTVRSVNRFGAEQLGYHVDELVGRDVLSVFFPADRDEVRAQLQRCVQRLGEVAHWEFRKVRRNGSVAWVKESARAVRENDGGVAVLIVCDDVTAQKQAEEKARQHQADLAHVTRVSLMGEMAAGLAHEINQPLAAIVNFTRGCQRRLRARDGADPNVLYTLEQVSEQALRAGKIIRRIRDFIRKEEPSFEWIDVNQLVRNVAQLAEPDGRQRGIDLRLDLAPCVPKVYVNGIQIEQVLLNLVRNGFDAMEGDTSGAKTLSIGTTAPDPTHLEVTVSDTGNGLSPELLNRIFDPFFSTKPSGLGLGLSISRSIIEAHGGRLWAEGTPFAGSTFRFSLSAEGALQTTAKSTPSPL